MSKLKPVLHEIHIASVHRADQLAYDAGAVVSSFGRNDEPGSLTPPSRTFMQSYFPLEGKTTEVDPMASDWQNTRERLVVAGYMHRRIVSAAIVKPDAERASLGVLGLATTPYRRGEGHATTIVRGILHLAAQVQYGEVRVMSAVERADAVSFWQRMRFEESDRIIAGSNLFVDVSKRRFVGMTLPAPTVQSGLLERLMHAKAQASELHQSSASESDQLQ